MPFELEKVIASGSVQELICQTIDFGATVEEIKEIRKTVIIDSCTVLFDKVIINGRLRKDIMFKAAGVGFPVPGTIQGCVGLSATINGQILDTDVDILFNTFIVTPGAKPGDRCVVLEAFVEGETEEPANINSSGTFSALVDKSIIFLCVKVVRDVIVDDWKKHEPWPVHEHQKDCGHEKEHGHEHEHEKEKWFGHKGEIELCPERRSTGFALGAPGAIPAPRPGLIPGSWIGPTLLFAGVLNPGIPTALPPANLIVNTTPSQVQGAVGFGSFEDRGADRGRFVGNGGNGDVIHGNGTVVS